MNNFYCSDFYWAVSIDNLARGLFVSEADAREFFAKTDPQKHDGDVQLWRLNGGYLCTPAVETKPYVEVEL